MAKPFIIYHGKNKTFRVKTVAKNHKTLNSSEAFVERRGAMSNIYATARVVNPALTDLEINELIDDQTLK